MSDFNREHRYHVIKRKHLTSTQDEEVRHLLQRLHEEGMPALELCVVVEPDWPIYEPVWAMVQDLAEKEDSSAEGIAQEALPAADIDVAPKGTLDVIAQRLGVSGETDQERDAQILESLDVLLGSVAKAQALADEDRATPVFSAHYEDPDERRPFWQSKLGRDLHVALKPAAGALGSHEADVIASLRFPTMLRKMWSGGEVQQWLDEQAAEWRRRALYE